MFVCGTPSASVVLPQFQSRPSVLVGRHLIPSPASSGRPCSLKWKNSVGIGKLNIDRRQAVQFATARARVTLVYAASASGPEGNNPEAPDFLAPVDPASPHGEMLAHILTEEPHLFAAAVDAQLDRLADEVEKEPAEDGGSGEESKSLVLYKRIREMKALERSRGLQDLMYASIINKFLNIGVDMLPPLNEDTFVRNVNLNRLTEGVHSVEALAMVREHLMAVLGPTAENAYSNQLVKMSKLQAAQVYAASIMFGYFVRRADQRFQLDRQMGMLPLNPLESAQALEELFNAASAMDSLDEVELAAELMVDMDEVGNTTVEEPSDSQKSGGKNTSLKQYIQSFDQETLAATARIVSMEGVALAERQTGALFGSIDELQQEMQQAIGQDIASPQELMAKVQEVVGAGDVQTLTLPYAAQRRIVLEAVAFGSFLRDVEGYVGGYNDKLLTPTSSASRPPPGEISG